MQSPIMDSIRSILWMINYCLLSILEGFFDIINKIWRYKFFDNEYINKIFNGAIIVACSWLVIKVILELILNHIVKNDGKDSPLSVYRGIVISIVMMFLITPLFQFGHSISTELTNSIISVSGLESSSKTENSISKTLIESMIEDEKMKKDDITFLVDNWKSISINETEFEIKTGHSVYKYSLNLFMLIILSAIIIFLLFFVAIQMAKRVMELALFKILGPFCCTSLISKQSRSFGVWTKSVVGAFLITAVQFISIGLLINMFVSSMDDCGALVSIFLIVGALLFIISTPTLVSSLLGEQSGMMTAIGDMQSLVAVGQGMSAGLGLAKTGISAVFSGGTSVLSKGGGIIKGGASQILNSMNKSNLTPSQMESVKQSFQEHNNWRAQNQIKQYLNENLGFKELNSPKFNSNMTSSGLRFNHLKNHYINQSNQFNKGNK